MSRVAVSVPEDRIEKPMPKPRVLWIDGVGNFALCEGNEVTLGQSFPGNQVDLAIRGDLSSRAAIFRRHGEDHLIQPLQSMQLDGKVLERAAFLSDGSVLTLGDRILLRYRRPTKLSGTARLELEGIHRWQPFMTAPLLMGESCVLGPDPSSHIVCPDWSYRLVLFRHQGGWMCRSSGSDPIFAGGVEFRGPFSVPLGQRICNDMFSMTLE